MNEGWQRTWLPGCIGIECDVLSLYSIVLHVPETCTGRVALKIHCLVVVHDIRLCAIRTFRGIMIFLAY
jgi:hypothetical protein